MICNSWPDFGIPYSAATLLHSTIPPSIWWAGYQFLYAQTIFLANWIKSIIKYKLTLYLNIFSIKATKILNIVKTNNTIHLKSSQTSKTRRSSGIKFSAASLFFTRIENFFGLKDRISILGMWRVITGRIRKSSTNDKCHLAVEHLKFLCI